MSGPKWSQKKGLTEWFDDENENYEIDNRDENDDDDLNDASDENDLEDDKDFEDENVADED